MLGNESWSLRVKEAAPRGEEGAGSQDPPLAVPVTWALGRRLRLSSLELTWTLLPFPQTHQAVS